MLLTLWFPVTQHCTLEAAGLITWQCSDDCTSDLAQADDGCSVVESGLYKAAGDIAKVPAPALQACDCFLCPPRWLSADLAEFTGVPVDATERSLDWVTTWQFVRRAAPPSRAPSLGLA